jgi:hypothetical protein
VPPSQVLSAWPVRQSAWQVLDGSTHTKFAAHGQGWSVMPSPTATHVVALLPTSVQV